MTQSLSRIAFAGTLLCSALSLQAHAADLVTDRNGNTGYLSAQACDAAVQGGTAKFYKPHTKQNPKLHPGEVSVAPMLLKELSPNYSKGACDKGVATARGRGGVSVALQGKWIPFSPNMEINAYKDKQGKVVRVTMRQCDNHFSDLLPRPASAVAAPAPAPASVVVAPTPAPAPAPVVVAAPAPAVAPAVKTAGVVSFPYVFGTFGAQRDLISNGSIAGIAQYDDHDTKLAMQGGVGYQINRNWGVEAFTQFGRAHDFEDGVHSKVRALGLRATIGQNLSNGTRLFSKVGVASVKHSGAIEGSQTRPTLGLGLTQSFSKNLALRSDLDVFFKKNSDDAQHWKDLVYLGIGLQYSFR